MMRGLAIDTDSAVILIVHPSLQGMTSGSGLSGSTAWHNSVRARMYFEKAPGDDKSLRVLRVKKNNYGPEQEDILLRWQNGIYQIVAGEDSLQRAEQDAKAEQAFYGSILRFTGQGRNVSVKPNAPTYAPTEFAKEPEAKRLGLKKTDFEAAMRRLLDAGKITCEPYGPPSRGWTRLRVVVDQPFQLHYSPALLVHYWCTTPYRTPVRHHLPLYKGGVVSCPPVVLRVVQDQGRVIAPKTGEPQPCRVRSKQRSLR
jgi:hypothetical protein